MALTRIGTSAYTTLDATKLAGNLPAISGASLTGISAGITEADMWRYTADTTGDISPITSNLERVDTVFDKIGTGMSESSGIFSFPSTGIYEVVFRVYSYIDGENRDINAQIEATTNDSAYTTYARSTSAQFHASSSNTSANAEATLMFDVTNISTHKVRFGVTFVNDNAHLYGETNSSLTWIRFTRLGDT